jgi:hypothetical protein
MTKEKARTLTGKFAYRESARVNKIIYGEEGITRKQVRVQNPEQKCFHMV